MKKVSALLLLLVVVGCTKGSYLMIPANACEQQYTGRTRTEYVTTTQCFSYNSDGSCMMNIPVTQMIEHKEVHTTCDHTEWK